MASLTEKALSARRESKYIEFKEGFDPSSRAEWCEIIKDIVAIANTGGGIILFGVDNVGRPVNRSIDDIARLDPAEVSDMLTKYTGSNELEIEIHELKKETNQVFGFVVHATPTPIAFRNPGTYKIGDGKQKSAFSKGTVYFRHGAKSEPGTTEDLRRAIDRQVDSIRKSWMKGVRKVVQAPKGSQIVALTPPSSIAGATATVTTFKPVKDSKATPVRLTRDTEGVSGILVHEQLGDGIFDEINNVIDANNVLAQGRPGFFLGEPVYYRIYSEREHVRQNDTVIHSLLSCATSSFYAPWIYWAGMLSEKLVGRALGDLYLQPKSPNIQHLLRAAVLLGEEFSKWLYGRWQKQWKSVSQPPGFFWSFQKMTSQLKSKSPMEIALRTSSSAVLQAADDQKPTVRSALTEPVRAAIHLSNQCFQVFEGNRKLRTSTRLLDILASGDVLRDKSSGIVRAFKEHVGDRHSETI